MNELDLYREWFKKQDKYVIIDKKKYARYGHVPIETTIISYQKDRDDIIAAEIIEKLIIENKNNKYVNDKELAEKIVRKIREVEKKVI